jgi:hypothetical protein
VRANYSAFRRVPLALPVKMLTSAPTNMHGTLAKPVPPNSFIFSSATRLPSLALLDKQAVALARDYAIVSISMRDCLTRSLSSPNLETIDFTANMNHLFDK